MILNGQNIFALKRSLKEDKNDCFNRVHEKLVKLTGHVSFNKTAAV